MGGGGPKIPTLKEAAGAAALFIANPLAAIAATSSDVQDNVQSTIDNAGLNPEAVKTKMENEAKTAENEQKKREAQVEENKSQAEYAKKNVAKRNRQRSLMGTAGGRSSTILTSGLGEPNLGGGKTLLGN